MPLEDLVLGMIAGGCGSLVLWVTIGRRMMLKYAGVSVARAFANPDPEMERALNGLMEYLWKWLNQPSQEVAGPNTDEGTPTKIKISPLQQVMGILINEIVNRTLQKIRGVQGSTQRDANRMEAGFAAQMGIPLPRKGQSSGEFLVEQLGQRLIPVIEQKINSALENVGKGGKKDLGGW